MCVGLSQRDPVKLAAIKAAAGPAAALADLVEDYLLDCRARNLSPVTLRRSYGFALREVFLPFCREHGIRDPAQLNDRILNQLTAQLNETGGRRGPLSPHSVKSYVSSINLFLRWARAEGLVDDLRAHSPRAAQSVPDVLSREDVERLEDAAKTERDKLIVRLLADTGIRAGELLGLRASDLIERDRAHYLRVTGKGNRERLVPIPRLYRRLQRYAQRGRPQDTNSDRIFLSLLRRPGGDYAPLTISGLEQMLRGLAEVAGFKKRVYPHVFRHSYATWALARGINSIMLAQILGHNSLAMIQRVYAHLSPMQSYDAMAKLLAEE